MYMYATSQKHQPHYHQTRLRQCDLRINSSIVDSITNTQAFQLIFLKKKNIQIFIPYILNVLVLYIQRNRHHQGALGYPQHPPSQISVRFSSLDCAHCATVSTKEVYIYTCVLSIAPKHHWGKEQNSKVSSTASEKSMDMFINS